MKFVVGEKKSLEIRGWEVMLSGEAERILCLCLSASLPCLSAQEAARERSRSISPVLANYRFGSRNRDPARTNGTEEK